MNTIQNLTKMQKIDIILLNGQVIVIDCGIITIKDEILSGQTSWCVMQYI